MQCAGPARLTQEVMNTATGSTARDHLAGLGRRSTKVRMRKTISAAAAAVANGAKIQDTTMGTTPL